MINKLSLQNIPIEIIYEIFDICVLIDGINLSMTNKELHNDFGIDYNMLSSLVIFIMSRIKDIKLSSYALVRRTFGQSTSFIERYSHNMRICIKAIRLGLNEILEDIGIDVWHDMISVPECFEKRVIKECFAKELFIDPDNRNKIWNLKFWRYLKNKLPGTDFRPYIRLAINNFTYERSMIQIICFMGYSDIIDEINCRPEYNVEKIAGYILGGHFNLFKDICEPDILSKISNVMMFCSGGNIEIFKMKCDMYNNDMYNNDIHRLVKVAMVHNKYDMVEYLLASYKVDPYPYYMEDIRLIPGICIAESLQKCINMNINIQLYLSVKNVCQNKDQKSVELLLLNEYEDETKFNECFCGHKWNL
jgi:hypothetical protein